MLVLPQALACCHFALCRLRNWHVFPLVLLWKRYVTLAGRRAGKARLAGHSPPPWSSCRRKRTTPTTTLCPAPATSWTCFCRKTRVRAQGRPLQAVARRPPAPWAPAPTGAAPLLVAPVSQTVPLRLCQAPAPWSYWACCVAAWDRLLSCSTQQLRSQTSWQSSQWCLAGSPPPPPRPLPFHRCGRRDATGACEGGSFSLLGLLKIPPPVAKGREGGFPFLRL